MSWTKPIKHPSEVLKKGDDVEAIITSIDQDNRRISLSIKEFQPNDLQAFQDKHQPGDIVEGVVTRVADFGVFVQIEGHGRGTHARLRDAARAGPEAAGALQGRRTIRVRILRIEEAEMKVGLSGLNRE